MSRGCPLRARPYYPRPDTAEDDRAAPRSVACARHDRHLRARARPLRGARAPRARSSTPSRSSGACSGTTRRLARVPDPAAGARLLAGPPLRAARGARGGRAASCRACSSSRRCRWRSRSAPASTSRPSASTSSRAIFVAAADRRLPLELRDARPASLFARRRAPPGDARRRRRAARASARVARREPRRDLLRVRRRDATRAARSSELLATSSLDELIVADAGLAEQRLLEIVEAAHRRGVKVRVAPRTTELLVERGEYVPGPGRAALRAAAADLRRRATGRPSASSTSSSASLIVVVGLPVWLLIALAIKLTSRGPVFFADARIGLGERPFRMLKFRTMVQGADRQQGRARGGERGERGALQDPRRPARDARSGASCAGSRSTRSRT